MSKSTLKKVVAFCLLAVVLGGGVGFGIYYYNRAQHISADEIKLYTPYFLSEIRIALYNYPNSAYPEPNGTIDKNAEGEPTAPFIGRKDQDKSYCFFGNNWKTFTVQFEHDADATAMPFVVTKVKRGNGGITAEICQVYDNEIRTFQITATKTEIILTAPTKYQITISSHDYTYPPSIDILMNAPAMRFARDRAAVSVESSYTPASLAALREMGL